MFPSAIPPVASPARLANTEITAACTSSNNMAVFVIFRSTSDKWPGCCVDSHCHSVWFTTRYREKFTDPIAVAALCISIKPAGVSS